MAHAFVCQRSRFHIGGKMEALCIFPRVFTRSRACLLGLALLGTTSGLARPGSQEMGAQKPAKSSQAQNAAPPVSLNELINEATQNNPEIAAAERGYTASTHVARQRLALPDTQVTLQLFSVGSPRPFAGYTNSDFAYIGLGVSQEIPYPGKRGLRAQVANREAEVHHVQIESVRRTVTGKLKAAYFRLAYLQQTLSVLERNDRLLKDVEQIVESRYRVGQGNQQEVLKAQLQHTKILQEITMHHREVGQLEAQLKQLLNRLQESPDIQTEPLAARALTHSASELLGMVKQQNPDVQARQAMLTKTASQVELAKKDFRPDFGIQYMYENTDRKFRDYYMASFSVTLPNRSRRKAELAEAEANREQANKQLEAEVQRRMAEVQDQYVVAQTSAEQLKIYKDGLLPQSNATFQSALAAYQANRQDFQTLMSSFMDVLGLELEYQRELADHEIALARLETLTGVNF
jgi:outer membrane protein, heavy metal efflux system